MAEKFENILIVAGSGRNCGKTTFLCSLIEQQDEAKIVAVKITPHFHSITHGLILLHETPSFRVFEEKTIDSEKDSSRYLQAGAVQSFYIQTHDDSLADAFQFAKNYFEKDAPVVVESASLAKYIRPALFLFIQKKDEELKESAITVLPMADRVVISDGKQFSFSATQIQFKQTWKIQKG